jgi:hypothetical protein
MVGEAERRDSSSAIRCSRVARRASSDLFSFFRSSFSRCASSIDCFCLSRDSFAAARFASFRSSRRDCFSASVLALGRTYRLAGRGAGEGVRSFGVKGVEECGEVGIEVTKDEERAGILSRIGSTVMASVDISFAVLESVWPTNRLLSSIRSKLRPHHATWLREGKVWWLILPASSFYGNRLVAIFRVFVVNRTNGHVVKSIRLWGRFSKSNR